MMIAPSSRRSLLCRFTISTVAFVFSPLQIRRISPAPSVLSCRNSPFKDRVVSRRLPSARDPDFPKRFPSRCSAPTDVFCLSASAIASVPTAPKHTFLRWSCVTALVASSASAMAKAPSAPMSWSRMLHTREVSISIACLLQNAIVVAESPRRRTTSACAWEYMHSGQPFHTNKQPTLDNCLDVHAYNPCCNYTYIHLLVLQQPRFGSALRRLPSLSLPLVTPQCYHEDQRTQPSCGRRPPQIGRGHQHPRRRCRAAPLRPAPGTPAPTQPDASHHCHRCGCVRGTHARWWGSLRDTPRDVSRRRRRWRCCPGRAM
eukprot:m.1336359 g.1336359  ORF g.1336359 m.1336359 type:complete len:316 (+) comp24879_c1_seq70:287-1234(+)